MDSNGALKNGVAGLLSFDIDGTMEMGDPPGPVKAKIVRRAREMGFLVGSCSDRPVRVQEMLWSTRDLVMDFIVIKHQLLVVRARFEVEAYYHIGDLELDQQFAREAGFTFVWPHEAIGEPWAMNGASVGALGNWKAPEGFS